MLRVLLFGLVIATLPKDAKEYQPEQWTQAISTNNNRPLIRYVKIADLDAKWHRSGGMTAEMQFTSRKFRNGGKPTYFMARLPVLNGFGYFQNELGLTRKYPDGVRFDDLLLNGDGVPFEHRVREKKEGRWISRVEWNNRDARPQGYTGLNGKTCASCHEQAGTGAYGAGLVPGGDGVLSDPFDWSAIR